MEITPINIFREWFAEEQKLTTVRIPSACCLSTIGTDGFPNARFVSLKEIIENSFIVTGPLSSRKGIEIFQIDKVALTFWWTETERQVRIQGNATVITEQLADKYFTERGRVSQIISIVSDQGKEIENIEILKEKYDSIEQNFASKNLTRPQNWGGYSIEPKRIEFLEFKPTRFHDRKFYELANYKWTMKQIQP